SRTATSGPDRARDDGGTGVDVAPGVPDDGRPAGRPARGVDAGDALDRYREHAEGIRLAQVVLGREREQRQVAQAAAVVRVDAGGVEALAVERDVVVRVPESPAQ